MKNLKLFRPAVMSLLVMVVLCGVIYTAVMTGIAQLIFPSSSNGSIITVTLSDGSKREYGSALIAQEFTDPKYLIGRPMAVSNLSPSSRKQRELVEERVNWWHAFDPDNRSNIPVDLVTASASGVDPRISPKAAEYQVFRIAKARGISETDVRKIIRKYTSGRFLGFIGEPAVNVLKVNLALDGLI